MAQPLCLAGLKKGREKDSVTVRIVRKWTVTDTTGQGLPLFVGMVWADAKGGAIYAEIPAITIPKKEHLFDIGKVYAINKFRVCNAKTSYRPFDATLMIEVTDYTELKLLRDPPNTIPQLIYNLTPFSEIVPVDRVVYTYTDVIGYITKYTALETFIPKGREKVKKLRKIYIKDISGNELKVTLWGDHAAQFSIDAVYDENAGNVIACLLLGCTPRREYDDYNKIYLSGSSSCCYYFNPHIPEAVPIYDRFKDTPVYIDRPAAAEDQPSTQTEDKPLQQKTLAELALIDPFDFEDGTYKCAVMITAIATDANWWYRSCKPCKKGAVQGTDSAYRCPRCQGTNIIPRYLLAFTAQDETAEARFFAYDEEAKQIIQKECHTIMNPLTVTRGIPQPLQDVIGKKYVFSIDLKDDSALSITDRQYLVKAVLEKPARRKLGTTMLFSGTSQQLVTTTALNMTQTADSIVGLKTLQPHSESLHISSSAPSTPASIVVTAETPEKTTVPRSTRRPDDTRRNLLGAFATAEKQISEQNTTVTTAVPPTISTHKDSSRAPPSSKRPRITARDDSSANSGAESPSTNPSD